VTSISFQATLHFYITHPYARYLPQRHSQRGYQDEPLLHTGITTLHFPDNDEVNMTQFEDNMSLLEVAAKFGIGPDAKVWQVGDPG
jgi:hypothetical protein